MTVSNIRQLNYRYKEDCPVIPVNFFYKDGTPTATFEKNAILDSGASGVAIPKWLADELELKYTKKEDHKGKTAGGDVDVYITKTDFNIGRSKVLVNYTNVEIAVLENIEDRILIGMKPVFDDFIVEIDGLNHKFKLEPRITNTTSK